MKDRDHIFLILKVTETIWTTHVQKASLKIRKGSGTPPIVGDVNLPIGLFNRTILAMDVSTHMGGPQINQTGTQAKQDDQLKET